MGQLESQGEPEAAAALARIKELTAQFEGAPPDGTPEKAEMIDAIRFLKAKGVSSEWQSGTGPGQLSIERHGARRRGALVAQVPRAAPVNLANHVSQCGGSMTTCPAICEECRAGTE
jgi:hypothetical protein